MQRLMVQSQVELTEDLEGFEITVLFTSGVFRGSYSALIFAISVDLEAKAFLRCNKNISSLIFKSLKKSIAVLCHGYRSCRVHLS